MLGVRRLRSPVALCCSPSHRPLPRHAMGNISLNTMEEALNGHHGLWGEQPSKAIFSMALVRRAGIWMLYERRQFRYGFDRSRSTRARPQRPGADHCSYRRCGFDLFGSGTIRSCSCSTPRRGRT
jgi:hypothetical protein